jgi:hypothetical protein
VIAYNGRTRLWVARVGEKAGLGRSCGFALRQLARNLNKEVDVYESSFNAAGLLIEELTR